MSFLVAAQCVCAQVAVRPQHWVATWATAPSPYLASKGPVAALALHDQTVRMIVHTSLGGSSARIRLSNAFGRQPLRVEAASLALPAKEGSVVASSVKALRFNGAASVTIPAGATVLSDAIDFALPPLSDVTISLYVPDAPEPGATHYAAMQTSYLAGGNQVMSAELAEPRAIRSWVVLSGLEVQAAPAAFSVVALGSSITDGIASTANANRRWTDGLNARLQARKGAAEVAVVNEGLSGNRVLHDGGGPMGAVFGPSASARFDRDVLAQAGVRFVILFEGGNDISQPGSDSAPVSETISAEDLITGMQQLAARAHEHGIVVIGGTLTPFEGMKSNVYNAEREGQRVAVNEWIRTTHELDGFIDFDKAVLDPAHPSRLLAAFDSGDHLHPNDAGYKALADSVPLSLFTPRR